MLNNKDADPISHFTDLAAVAKSISALEYFLVTTNGRNVYGDITNGKTEFFTETEFNLIVSNFSKTKTQNSVPFYKLNPSEYNNLKPYRTCVAFSIPDGTGNTLGLLCLLDGAEKLLPTTQIEAIGDLCLQIGKLIEERACLDLQNFSEIFELSEDLICICSLDGNLENVNPSFERILGWKNDEIIGKLLYDFVHEKDKWYTKTKLGSLLKDISRIGFTHRLLDAKNEFKTIEWVATVVPTTGKVSAIGRDITEEIDKQQKLLQSEKKFKIFFENSQGLMCTHDLAGKFISVNESGAKILGYTKTELDGFSLYDIVPEKKACVPRPISAGN